MLLEVSTYLNNNTSAIVCGLRLGEAYKRTLTATLVSLREETRQYSNGKPVKMYGMVLMDQDKFLFKAVLNSGLSFLVGTDTPKVGANITLEEYKVLNKQSDDPLVRKGLLFVTKYSWKPPPKVTSILEMFDRYATPNLVPSDHDTIFFDSDFVDSVYSNSTLLVPEGTATIIRGERLWYFVEKQGDALQYTRIASLVIVTTLTSVLD